MTDGWSLGEIAKALGVPIDEGHADRLIRSISTDTRTIEAGSLFVPLVGENFDGHDFAEAAVTDKGASALVWARQALPEWLPGNDVVLLHVDDTLEAYQFLGLHWKRRCRSRCVAVTGSVGKTTTKEFISHLLSEHFSVHKSRANFNNDIGVPKTLLELTPDNEIAVIEMGMRGPGEIARLARVSEPEIGVITAIGTSHLELLGSREAIARAKGELVEGLPSSGRAILPRDDEFYSLLCELSKAPVIAYSDRPHPEEPDVLAPEAITDEDSEGTTFVWNAKSYRLGIPGRHHLHDLFAALACGKSLGIDVEELLGSVSGMSHPEGRAEWQTVAGARFFLDCYNSAPESLRASLGVLSSCPSRRIAVLADMLELGSQGPEHHHEIGVSLGDYGVDLLLAYGPLARHFVEGAKESGIEAHWFDSKDALTTHLEELLCRGDSVLIKASRGMALETVVETIKERVG